jgi:hypothetical protein
METMDIDKDHGSIKASRFGTGDVIIDLHNSALGTGGAIYLTPQEAVNLGSFLLNLGRKMMEDES